MTDVKSTLREVICKADEQFDALTVSGTIRHRMNMVQARHEYIAAAVSEAFPCMMTAHKFGIPIGPKEFWKDVEFTCLNCGAKREA